MSSVASSVDLLAVNPDEASPPSLKLQKPKSKKRKQQAASLQEKSPVVKKLIKSTAPSVIRKIRPPTDTLVVEDDPVLCSQQVESVNWKSQLHNVDAFNPEVYHEQLTVFPEEFPLFQGLNENGVIQTPIDRIENSNEQIQLDSLVDFFQSVLLKQALEAVSELYNLCLLYKMTVVLVPDLSKLIAFWNYFFTSTNHQYTEQSLSQASWKEYCIRYLDYTSFKRFFHVRAWTLLLAYCWRAANRQEEKSTHETPETPSSCPVTEPPVPNSTTCTSSVTSCTESRLTSEPDYDFTTLNLRVNPEDLFGGPPTSLTRTRLNSSSIHITEKEKSFIFKSNVCSGDYLIDMRIYPRENVLQVNGPRDLRRAASTRMKLWCQENDVCYTIAKALESQALLRLAKDPGSTRFKFSF